MVAINFGKYDIKQLVCNAMFVYNYRCSVVFSVRCVDFVNIGAKRKRCDRSIGSQSCTCVRVAISLDFRLSHTTATAAIVIIITIQLPYAAIRYHFNCARCDGCVSE